MMVFFFSLTCSVKYSWHGVWLAFVFPLIPLPLSTLVSDFLFHSTVRSYFPGLDFAHFLRINLTRPTAKDMLELVFP